MDAGIILQTPGGGAAASGAAEVMRSLPEAISPWLPFSFIAVIIGAFVVAIAYIIGEAFQHAAFKAWAKDELYEVFISMVYVGSIVFIAGILHVLALYMVNTDYFTYADAYLDTVIKDMAKVYAQMLVIEYWIGIIQSFNMNVELGFTQPFLVMINVNPWAGYGEVFNAFKKVIDPLGYVILINWGLKMLLLFFKTSALKFFLPLGILMRTFTFTRKIGTTLIVMAIAAYFVYPIALGFNYKVYTEAVSLPFSGTTSKDQSDLYNDALDEQQKAMAISADEILAGQEGIMNLNNLQKMGEQEKRMAEEGGAVIDETKKSPSREGGGMLRKLKENGKVVTTWSGKEAAKGGSMFISFMKNIKNVWIFSSAKLLFDTLASYMSYSMYPIVVVLALNIIDLIIVVTFVRSLAFALGGETQLVGFEKLM